MTSITASDMARRSNLKQRKRGERAYRESRRRAIRARWDKLSPAQRSKQARSSAETHRMRDPEQFREQRRAAALALWAKLTPKQRSKRMKRSAQTRRKNRETLAQP